MEALAILVRWSQFTGASLFVGVFAFLILVGRPAAGPAWPETLRAFEALDARFLSLALWALGLTLASGLLDLWREVAVATGTGLRDSLALASILTLLGRTRYGTVWLLRHALLVLAGALFLFRGDDGGRADWIALRLEGLALGATSLGMIGAASHAASSDWAPGAAILVDAAHLLGTGVWLGGLLPLVLFLRWSLALPDRVGTQTAAAATQRFSTLGIVSVLVLVATGLYNAWVQVAGFPALLGTPYGQWLSLKLLLLLGLLGVAALNLLVVRPRLTEMASTEMPDSRPLIRRLQRRVLLEFALGVSILGVVAVLGLATPARHAPISWPFSFRFAWSATRTLPGVQARVAVGSQLVVLGLVTALLALILRRRRWPWITGGGSVAIALGLVVALPPIAIDANPDTYLRSPIPYTAASIVDGQRLYAANCVTCHGRAGYGNGPGAAGLRPRPADLTAKHTADHTAGDLFWWLTRGVRGSAMPGFADRLSPDGRWDLINFLRALGAAERARDLGPTIAPAPSVVAPDFAFTGGVGEGQALKDYRGRRIVLLVFFSLPDSLARLVSLNEVYPRLSALGAQVLAIPLEPGDVYRRLGDRALLFPVVVDGAAEAAQTYALFRRDLTPLGQLEEPPMPRHMELLVDRQGFLRARWIPGEKNGWADPTRLLVQVEHLAREAPQAPAPDEHVH